ETWLFGRAARPKPLLRARRRALSPSLQPRPRPPWSETPSGAQARAVERRLTDPLVRRGRSRRQGCPARAAARRVPRGIPLDLLLPERRALTPPASAPGPCQGRPAVTALPTPALLVQQTVEGRGVLLGKLVRAPGRG